MITQTGIELIAAERRRQIDSEGWTPEHDDQHTGSELVVAAVCYAIKAADPFSSFPFLWWPWKNESYKPKDPLSNLIRAGALITAEIDRRLRDAKAAEDDH